MSAYVYSPARNAVKSLYILPGKLQGRNCRTALLKLILSLQVPQPPLPASAPCPAYITFISGSLPLASRPQPLYLPRVLEKVWSSVVAGHEECILRMCLCVIFCHFPRTSTHAWRDLSIRSRVVAQMRASSHMAFVPWTTPVLMECCCFFFDNKEGAHSYDLFTRHTFKLRNDYPLRSLIIYNN